MNQNVSTENAIVYHISKISEKWNISNPYAIALRCLLLGKIQSMDHLNFQEGQIFHFSGKIIIDEISNNRSEIQKNCVKIKNDVALFLQTSNVNLAEKLSNIFFHIMILDLMGNSIHLSKIGKSSIQKFLEKTGQTETVSFVKILKLYYTSENVTGDWIIQDSHNLSEYILFLSIKLNHKNYRDEKDLADLFVGESKLENTLNLETSSEVGKTKLLQIALNLQAAYRTGLFLPEIEKKEYLSHFMKSITNEKFVNIIRDQNVVNLFGIKTKKPIIALALFLIEAALFSLPENLLALNLGPFSVNSNAITSLPIPLIIILNGIALTLYLFDLNNSLEKKVRDDLWK